MARDECCTLQKCCFCCIDLRTGALIAACVNLLVSSCVFAFWVWLAYQSNTMLELIASGQEEERPTEIQLLYLVAFFWVSVITSVVTCLAALLDIMLLAGVINARRRLLLAWLVGYGIVYGIYLLLMTVCFSQIPISQAILPIILISVQTALAVYFWVVVRSYRAELGRVYGDGGCYTAGRVYSTAAMGDDYHYGYSYTGSLPRPPQ